MITLTTEQQDVVNGAIDFLYAPRVAKPYYVIEGLAGTGKSVLLAHIAREVSGSLLCAPTGKAASVLARKSGLQTSTIHSAIYKFRGEYIDDYGDRQLSFEEKIETGAWNRRFALLDEHSMVGTEIATALLNTGCRVVATGDPGQLPPVRSQRFFNAADAALHTVHRQALESPIIRQAHRMRNEGSYSSDGDDFRVQRNIGRDDILAADIILCWRNATRLALNGLVRAHRGLSGLPVAGEPLMRLKRNDRKKGVLNGALYTLLEDYSERDKVVVIVNEYGHRIEIENCRLEGVDEEDPEAEVDENWFTLAYAATCHKAQGSEFENGILVDEYSRSDFRREFMYTGFTRFSKRILVHSSLG